MRDAIDGVRALLAILERSIPQELRPLRDALSQLQMAYAREVRRRGAAGAGRRAAGEQARPAPAQRRRRPARRRPASEPGGSRAGASRAAGCGCPGS